MSVSCVNCTSVSEFILGGLTETPHLEKVLCSIFFLIYAMNVAGNLSIIIIVALDCNLHSPMYFFLGNLSFLDICFSSVAVPRMLHDFITRQKVISLAACLAQMHFFHFLGSTEVLLLTAMSYDRFIAICRPLHYTEIMNRKLCLTLAIGSWATGFLHSLLHTISTSLLPFCGPNIVNHFFCDIKPLLKLSCTNTSFNSSLLLLVTGSLVMISFLLTLLSYIYIGYTLAWIPSATGRSRGFSTCAAHLIVVILLYGTALFTYLRPVTEKSIEIDRIAAILFTILTPMLNPIIYTLRNQDVQNALVKLANSWI
ncbi:olfactory receptor 12D1-like [Spea bombifrons]|uniref:olfactory receptor 12D1-like n=1 Tax=Spea bombifrons TaxID=233779 RepID=UPI00234983CA|nr:olfactory receptor 12D1-like [Spea bombifrons]